MQTFFQKANTFLNRNELTNLNKITQFDVRFTLLSWVKKEKKRIDRKDNNSAAKILAKIRLAPKKIFMLTTFSNKLIQTSSGNTL